MKCFEQRDFVLEDKLKKALFAIDEIIPTSPSKLIEELVKVKKILQKEIEKEHSGIYD